MMKNNNQQSNNTKKCHSRKGGNLESSDKKSENKKTCHTGLDPVSKSDNSKQKKSKKQNDEIVVSVNDVSKIFKIPHKKIDSMRNAFVNMFKKQMYDIISSKQFNIEKYTYLL